MNIPYYIGARAKNALRFGFRRLQGFAGQYGQDRWVMKEVFPGRRGGYFVDLGAYDGYISSNTYILERRFGWDGLCIEAHPHLFATLQRRRRCRCVQACVAAGEGTADFLASASAWGGIVECYPQGRREQLLRYLPVKRVLQGDRYRTVTVPTRPLASILRDAGAPRVIDYLSLDTEGSEYEILRTFPFDEYCFLSMTVEHNNVSSARDAIRALLVANGYVFVRQGGIDDFFIHERIAGTSPALRSFV